VCVCVCVGGGDEEKEGEESIPISAALRATSLRRGKGMSLLCTSLFQRSYYGQW
jgi:hypothetical protein